MFRIIIYNVLYIFTKTIYQIIERQPLINNGNHFRQYPCCVCFSFECFSLRSYMVNIITAKIEV